MTATAKKTTRRAGKSPRRKLVTEHDVKAVGGGSSLTDDELRAASGGALQAYLKTTGKKQGQFKGE